MRTFTTSWQWTDILFKEQKSLCEKLRNCCKYFTLHASTQNSFKGTNVPTDKWLLISATEHPDHW